MRRDGPLISLLGPDGAVSASWTGPWPPFRRATHPPPAMHGLGLGLLGMLWLQGECCHAWVPRRPHLAYPTLCPWCAEVAPQGGPSSGRRDLREAGCLGVLRAQFRGRGWGGAGWRTPPAWGVPQPLGDGPLPPSREAGSRPSGPAEGQGVPWRLSSHKGLVPRPPPLLVGVPSGWAS